MFKGQTTLPWWAYILSLIVGAFITPFSTLLFARMGNGIATNQLMKMVAGAVNPGKPVANLYVRTGADESEHELTECGHPLSSLCGVTMSSPRPLVWRAI